MPSRVLLASLPHRLDCVDDLLDLVLGRRGHAAGASASSASSSPPSVAAHAAADVGCGGRTRWACGCDCDGRSRRVAPRASTHRRPARPRPAPARPTAAPRRPARRCTSPRRPPAASARWAESSEKIVFDLRRRLAASAAASVIAASTSGAAAASRRATRTSSTSITSLSRLIASFPLRRHPLLLLTLEHLLRGKPLEAILELRHHRLELPLLLVEPLHEPSSHRNFSSSVLRSASSFALFLSGMPLSVESLRVHETESVESSDFLRWSIRSGAGLVARRATAGGGGIPKSSTSGGRGGCAGMMASLFNLARISRDTALTRRAPSSPRVRRRRELRTCRVRPWRRAEPPRLAPSSQKCSASDLRARYHCFFCPLLVIFSLFAI